MKLSSLIGKTNLIEIKLDADDLATEVYEHKKAMQGGREPAPELDQGELLAAMQRAKAIAK